MNLKEYIRSGVVESYVLGIATEAEQQEFEQMCAAYPEVAEARDQFERSLEAVLIEEAVQPPVYVKEKVFEAIAPSATNTGYPAITGQKPVRQMNPWMWAAAASLLFAIALGYWAFSTHQKYNDMMAAQAATQQQLQQARAELQAAGNSMEGLKVVSVSGTKIAPQAQTFVFWDTTRTNDVYMLIKNLPQTPSDKQYQLWALLDGKPIDLGVFDVSVQQKPLLVRMKNVQNAQAFAITLEERGGKPAPEGEMYAVGEL